MCKEPSLFAAGMTLSVSLTLDSSPRVGAESWLSLRESWQSRKALTERAKIKNKKSILKNFKMLGGCGGRI